MMILQLNQSLKLLKLKYEYHKEAYTILENIMVKKNLTMGEKKWQKCQEGQN